MTKTCTWKICALLGFLFFYKPIESRRIDCTANGTMMHCPTACPETCEYSGIGPCIRMCGGPCVCKPGYVINERIPACVLRSDCPKDVVPREYMIGGVHNFSCFGASNMCLLPPRAYWKSEPHVTRRYSRDH
ncbi:accessory gland protein Acp62F [Drosophila erecta]|uniref:TIL domain-containing protein n=1 Tax=Drosophila erecta TaxID=7220 RepID=B3NEZ4_DROER|nr:accessory gland protein Acp62F [Drosophila erecta]EDV50336.1 uncharacterized protein Dere_GG14885 [Drosophila erecta]